MADRQGVVADVERVGDHVASKRLDDAP